MFDMNALAARVTARRAEAGLIAKDGVACAKKAQKAYHDLRHDLKQRSDWGNLPADLEAQLIAAKAAAHRGAKTGGPA